MKHRAPGSKADIRIRMTEPLRADIESSAAREGISMNEEMVKRLERSYDWERMLDQAFELSYGPRAGLIRWLGEIVRRGGGSEALISALKQWAVPDLTTRPDGLADELVEEAGYPGDHPLMARNAAVWRERLGPEISTLAVAAYHRRIDELKQNGPRKREQPDPEIQEQWAEAFRRSGVKDDPEGGNR
jgi:hypothetical protein